MSDMPSSKAPLHIRLKDLWDSIRKLFHKGLHWYNKRMSKIYSPSVAAFTGSAIVLLIAVFLLFIPPYVGVADDGSLSTIMESVGLNYRHQDLDQTVGSYYIRIFLHGPQTDGQLSTHRMFIRFAMFLDDLFTGDNLFDVRFLALVYLIAYIPAVWLLLRRLIKRVRNAAEATFLVVIAAFILGDGTTLSYFLASMSNSAHMSSMARILVRSSWTARMAASGSDSGSELASGSGDLWPPSGADPSLPAAWPALRAASIWRCRLFHSVIWSGVMVPPAALAASMI